MKKTAVVVISLMMIALFIYSVSSKDNSGTDYNYSKFSYSFIGSFDTYIELTGYTKNQAEFEDFAYGAEKRFEELHKMFDIYNNYEGINNIKTINDFAGIKPVEVCDEIIELLIFSKEWYEKTDGNLDVVLGPVLKIWHDYRTAGNADPANAKLPDMNELQEAFSKADISKMLIDEQNRTVYLEEKGMAIDVGALAKGFATEIVANELIGKGFESFILSGGGNVKTVGAPIDPLRNKWGIGIQDPDETALVPESETIDVLFANDTSVVTSGDYQRFYYVGDKIYHHIIDPETLMPADYFRAVVVMTPDSGVADALSTALFCVPLEEGRSIAQSLGNVDVLWIMKDTEIFATPNMKANLKELGGARNN